jgi:hypothetical protein
MLKKYFNIKKCFVNRAVLFFLNSYGIDENLAGDEACFEQHLEDASDQGVLAIRMVMDERADSRSEDFLGGEIRAVLREICLGRTR